MINNLLIENFNENNKILEIIQTQYNSINQNKNQIDLLVDRMDAKITAVFANEQNIFYGNNYGYLLIIPIESS